MQGEVTPGHEVAIAIAQTDGDSNGAVPRVSYRAGLIQKASQRLPMTAEGLPVGFYRVDLLPQVRPKDAAEEMLALKNAYVDLSFEQSFPTLNDGKPYWFKLDFEPGFAYGCFQVYLELIDCGPRELTTLSINEELLRLAAQVHGLNGDGERFAPKRLYGILLEYSNLYSWRYRAKAHDIYKEAAFRHQRLRRQANTEDNHYEMAVSYIRKLKDNVLDKPDFFDKLKPRDALDMLHKLVNIQRISAGLPAGGPLSMKEASDDTSFEMIMRTLTQKVGQSAAGNIYDQQGANVSRDVLQSVLEDKDAASMLQEVVIRVTSASHKGGGNSNSNSNSNDPNTNRQFKGRGRKIEPITDDDIQPYDISGAPGENLDGQDNLTGDDEISPETSADDAPKH